MNDHLVSILKYANPEKVLSYMKEKRIGRDWEEYLLRIHFPWMTIPLGLESYVSLYYQAYLATYGRANPQYQNIYNSYIEPILMDKIGQYFWQNQKSDYLQLYTHARRNPLLVRNLLEGNISPSLAIEGIQLNADIDDTEFRGGDIDLDQEEIDLFPPMRITKLE